MVDVTSSPRAVLRKTLGPRLVHGIRFNEVVPCPHSPIPGVPTTKKTLGRGYPVPYFKDSPDPSFLNSSEFVDLHRTVPRSRWTAGHFRILIFLRVVKNVEKQGRKNGGHFFIKLTFIGR